METAQVSFANAQWKTKTKEKRACLLKNVKHQTPVKESLFSILEIGGHVTGHQVSDCGDGRDGHAVRSGDGQEEVEGMDDGWLLIISKTIDRRHYSTKTVTAGMWSVARVESNLTKPNLPRWWKSNLTSPFQVVGQELEGSAIGLPAGYEDILSRLPNYWAVHKNQNVCFLIWGKKIILDSHLRPYNPDSFSCEGQDYGYYADVESGCEVL